MTIAELKEEVLMLRNHLGRLSTRLSEEPLEADSERESGELVPHTGFGMAHSEGPFHAQTSSEDGRVSTPVSEAQAVSQAVRLTFGDGSIWELRFPSLIPTHIDGFPNGLGHFRHEPDGSLVVIQPVTKIERVPA